MSVSVLAYTEDDESLWDDFCEIAVQATFLHTRRYIAYHRDRFVDRSLLIFKDGQLIALFPAALLPVDEAIVVSHPGLTYGGLLHTGHINGGLILEIFAAIVHHYRVMGICRVQYKAVPSIYHTLAASDDHYALFRFDARRVACGLSSAINLQSPGKKSKRRQRALNKAARFDLKLSGSRSGLRAFFEVLTHNLRQRHDAAPVHSYEELSELMARFPQGIRCQFAYLNGRCVAGVIMYLANKVAHAQYIASTAHGNDVSALDAVFDACIRKATEEGYSWFDFGVSTLEDGHRLNDGLNVFKTEFGAGGVVYETFEIDVSKTYAVE